MEQPNLSYIKELSGGEKAFEIKLITIIKNEFPLEEESYLENIKLRKFKDAADNVHKIKHKISILGLTKSYEVANNYEKNLLEGGQNLEKEFNSILGVITKFLKEL